MNTTSRFQRFVLSSHYVWVFSVLFSVYMYGWSTQWTFDATLITNYAPGRFFVEQANSMLNGHFWVPESALPIECFIIDGKCVGYFGVFPSLIRMPLVLIFGNSMPELGSLFIPIASGIIIWSSLDLCLRVLRKDHYENSLASSWFLILVSLVIGPGSNLMLIFDPYIYQESIMWSIAGFLLAVNFYWRWSHERRPWQITGMILACAAAGASRPTTVLTGLFLTVGIVVLVRNERQLLKRLSYKLILLALLPFLTSFGVLALKMGSPKLDFSKYQAMQALQNVANKNGGSLEYSPRYIPTTMFSYFRPDALNLGTEWPWVRFLYGPPSQGPLSGPWYNELKPVTYLAPLEEDSMWLERTTSITNTMPLALLATIISAVVALRRRQWPTTLILLAGLSAPVVIFVQFAIAARYLADFYPVLALGTIFSAALIPRFIKLKLSSRVMLMSSISIALVFSIITVTMLGSQYSWLSQFGATG